MSAHGRWDRVLRRGAVTMLLVIGLRPGFKGQSVRAAGPTVARGRLAGATYDIEMPAHWNGTLLLWSHGDQGPGRPHLSEPGDADQTPGWLLAHGFALATSSFRRGGWSIASAMQDQIALLDHFTRRYGRPRYTIAWGQSSGALISAGLAQEYPSRFAGALPECGVFDAVGIWNAALDAAFAFKMLLAPQSSLRLTHMADPSGNLARAQRVLRQAERTRQGRARLTLVAALLDVPDWSGSSPRAARRLSVDARATSLIIWLRSDTLPLIFAGRAELEQSAGGNPSSNTGVNYATQLAHSVDRDDVRTLYRQAGLSLTGDLRALARAPRVAADPGAARYLARNITLTGRLLIPVLTLHTTGDQIAPVEQEQAYADRVRAAGDWTLLRQLFVQRTGHGTFTAPEEITALQILMRRVQTGQWGTLAPQALNRQARALGKAPQLANGGATTAPAFVAYRPPPYARPLGDR